MNITGEESANAIRISQGITESCKIMLGGASLKLKEKSQKVKDGKKELETLKNLLSSLVSSYASSKKGLEDFVAYNTALIKERQKRLYDLGAI
jgi:hypothetical protein